MSSGPTNAPLAEAIRDWLVERVSSQLKVDAAEVDLDEPLTSQGIDSMQFVVVIGELEDWLGCRFADNPLVKYPTIRELAEFLERQLAEGRTMIDSTRE